MTNQKPPEETAPAKRASMKNNEARYIMIGGFLGAGKTTAVARLAQWLAQRHLRVGLITNDQGSHLVDTNMLSAHGFQVEEIPGGCFCCRFNSLVDAARRLAATCQPEVFIAEPVGSCTDLAATVTYPLRQLYGDNFTIAPLSVLIDPFRAMKILGLESGQTFSDKVIYIYRKQLEEADIIVINKADLLTEEKTKSLQSTLAKEFPKARIFTISARNGIGLEDWFQLISTTKQEPRPTMEVDYQVYADGEALLGWLNTTLQLKSQKAFDANKMLKHLALLIQQRLNAAGAEVAHLKMTLDSKNLLGDLAVINLVRNDFVPELSLNLKDPFQTGELTINMRAETSPEILRDTVKSAVEETLKLYPASAMTEHLEFFRPGKPSPTHRVKTSQI